MKKSTVFFLFLSILGILLSKLAYADCNKLCISMTEQCAMMPIVSFIFTAFSIIFLGILILESVEPKTKHKELK